MMPFPVAMCWPRAWIDSACCVVLCCVCLTARWTPRQAGQHPFITGAPFTGPFQPPPDSPPPAMRSNHLPQQQQQQAVPVPPSGPVGVPGPYRGAADSSGAGGGPPLLGTTPGWVPGSWGGAAGLMPDGSLAAGAHPLLMQASPAAAQAHARAHAIAMAALQQLSPQLGSSLSGAAAAAAAAAAARNSGGGSVPGPGECINRVRAGVWHSVFTPCASSYHGCMCTCCVVCSCTCSHACTDCLWQ
jgi:hypothetical protein